MQLKRGQDQGAVHVHSLQKLSESEGAQGLRGEGSYSSGGEACAAADRGFGVWV